MNWSLGETQALSHKAAVGAGYTHGQAEDAARATRWLCAHSLPGTQALAEVLCARIPGAEDQCPILAGTRLCDGALGIHAPPDTLGRLHAPLLTLPFAVWAATRFSWHSTLRFAQVRAALCPDAPPRLQRTLIPVEVGPVPVHFAPFEERGLEVSRATRATPTAAAAAILNDYAMKTYAPPSETSRTKGAGAAGPEAD